MIGRLTGAVVERAPGAVVLDVGGVGYAVHISLQTFYALQASPTDRASLHIHTHVREDSLQLFGFASLKERRTFELLIGISGVGPKLALGILSGIGVDELNVAIARQDRARMQKIPGVGKKTAERLLLELRDKVGSAEVDLPQGPDTPPGGGPSGLAEDAISALVNLGYSRSIAERAVVAAAAAEGDEARLESILRGALAKLVR